MKESSLNYKGMEIKHLTTDIITKLGGRPIRLSSPYTEGKLLTIDPTGEATLEYPGKGFDQRWRLISVEGGFLLVSSRNGDMVCHRIKDEGVISSRPLQSDTKDCVWKLGKGGEFYQEHPDGGERYLWFANDKLFATLDGFLAEKWTPLSDFEQFTVSSPQSQSNFLLFVLIALVFVALFLFWLKKK